MYGDDRDDLPDAPPWAEEFPRRSRRRGIAGPYHVELPEPPPMPKVAMRPCTCSCGCRENTALTVLEERNPGDAAQGTRRAVCYPCGLRQHKPEPTPEQWHALWMKGPGVLITSVQDSLAACVKDLPRVSRPDLKP